ncbi:hypothetical protein LJC56_02210 [Christensenellaceae bacterium OttesenSCG-928-K19]|nr:hypothetical protein [Christensenellaceae bacterium OttesenSCG-928-K19]
MPLQAAFALPHPPIILPEVGRGEEKAIHKTTDGFRAASRMIANLQPETIVICSPHSVLYADYFHISEGKKYRDSMRRFGVPGLTLEAEYDEEFVGALCGIAAKEVFPAGTLGTKEDVPDHATFIPLYFLNQQYTNYKLVRVGLSGLSLHDHFRFGKMIAQAAADLDRKTVLVASGDLSHKLKEDGPYGYDPMGPVFDGEIADIFSSGRLEELEKMDPSVYEPAAECGLRSFVIMAGALYGTRIKPEMFSCEGPFGVGYATAAFLTE